jgi:hypothetical protein
MRPRRALEKPVFEEARGEVGACGVPTFAECLFDNVPLPKLNPKWPPVVVERWHTISDNLAELREWLAVHPQE